MILELAAKRRFVDQGFLVVPGVLARERVDDVLHAINHSLGEGIPREELATYRAQSYCPELQDTELLRDLFDRSPAWECCEDLVGAGKLQPARRFQIALRFPLPQGTPAKPTNCHLDGIGTGTNGIPAGTYRRFFTGIAVFLLSDLPRDKMGNFTVIPGSHRAAAQLFQRRGHEILADGMPPWEEFGDLPEPVAVTGRAGDLVIAHHLLLHAAGQNLSPHIRYAAICRIRHVDVEEFAEEALVEPWHEWPGLREVVGG